MSDTVDTGSPVPLSTFAETLRPRKVGSRTAASRLPGAPPHVIDVFTPGHPDEIWLKLLEMNHRIERHTLAGWRAVIDRYRGEPAHPTVTGG